MKSVNLTFKNLWKPSLVALAVVFLYATVLTKLVGHWWTDENYSHGLLVPFIIGYVIWFKFGKLKKAPKIPQFWIGGGLIIFALMMLLGGTLGAEFFVQRISFVLMIAGIIIYFLGTTIFRMLSVPFVLFLLAVPIPQIIFNKIAFPLQIYASQFAVWGIRLFGMPTVRKGNVIEILPEGAVQIIALEVVEACSGIRSLMTLMTLALVLVYFTRRNDTKLPSGWFDFLKNSDFWRGVILMFSAIPIAILTNAGRVTATGVLTYYYGKKATESVAHDLAGWLVYLVALVLLIGLNFFLRKFLKWKDGGGDFKSQISNLKKENIQNENSSFVTRNWQFVIVLVAVLFAGGLFINWFENRGEVAVERKPLSQISSELGKWKQRGSDIKFSEATESVLGTSDYVMREYIKDGRIGNIYVGYYSSQKSGATYHSPLNCLPGAGWEMQNPELVEIKTTDGKTFQANRYIIENGQYKEIMIYWYQGRGRAQASEYYDKFYTVWDSVTRRRSDGAMVRVMTSVGHSEKEATNAAIDLAAQTVEILPAFIPE
jgi:exosortase D (VPLPA-CTERM-specific)